MFHLTVTLLVALTVSQLVPNSKTTLFSRAAVPDGDKFLRGGQVLQVVRAVQSHVRTPDHNKDNACSICHKRFSRPSHLEMHIRCHNGERPFVCAKCNLGFTQNSHLSRHRGSIHCKRRSERLYSTIRNTSQPCPKCSKTFNNTRSLRRHVRRQHLMLWKFQCKNCSRTFRDKGDLLMHLTKHTKELLEECPKCNRRFSTKRGLRNHIKKTNTTRCCQPRQNLENVTVS